MKKILHFKIPTKSSVINWGADVTSPQVLGQFLQITKNRLGDEFVVVASPYEPSLLSDEDVLYNFDMRQITFAELKEMIGDESEVFCG